VEISAQHRFEVIARAYSRLVMLGIKPDRKLCEIGREFGLKTPEINSIRLRAMHWAKKQSVPKGVDDKRFILPSPKEERERMGAAA
jgi:hypothetical protein